MIAHYLPFGRESAADGGQPGVFVRSEDAELYLVTSFCSDHARFSAQRQDGEEDDRGRPFEKSDEPGGGDEGRDEKDKNEPPPHTKVAASPG